MKITLYADDYEDAFAALVSVREALRVGALPRRRGLPAVMVPENMKPGDPGTHVWGTRSEIYAKRVRNT